MRLRTPLLAFLAIALSTSYLYFVVPDCIRMNSALCLPVNPPPVQAVITKAGATSGKPEPDMGVDLVVSSVSVLPTGKFQPSGFSFHCALKASTTCEVTDDHVIFDMEVEDFNKLANWEGLSCCILVVFVLSEEEEDWFYLDEEQLLLRRCCYWYLVESKPSKNSSQQRVKIPRGQMFTPEVVNWLLHRERRENGR